MLVPERARCWRTEGELASQARASSSMIVPLKMTVRVGNGELHDSCGAGYNNIPQMQVLRLDKRDRAAT